MIMKVDDYMNVLGSGWVLIVYGDESMLSHIRGHLTIKEE